MKSILVFFICIFTLQYAYAQNVAKLSYTQIDSLLYLYENKKAYDKGIQFSLEASQRSGKQDSLCGEYLGWTAYFYELIGDEVKTIEYYKKTLKVFDQSIGIISPRYATTLNFLGLFYWKIGSYDLALPLYLQAISIREKTLGKEHPDFSNSLSNLAFLYKSTGDYDLALSLFIQNINIKEKVLEKEHPSFSMALNNLAALHQIMGNYDLALPLFIQANKIYEKTLGKEHPDFATSLNNLASLHNNMGNYNLALPLFIQANKIYEKTLGKEHPEFAHSINNLAVVHRKMGNIDLALPLYLQASNIYKKTLGKEHSHFATSLNNLAFLHNDMGNYNLALALFVRANKIFKKTLGKEHPTFARSLNSIASLHNLMGNHDLALSVIMEASAIFEKTLGKEHPDFAKSLNDLANFHNNMKNYDLALFLYIQASNIFEKTLGKEHPTFTKSLNNIASLHCSMGNYDLAWFFLEQAINSSSTIQLKHSFNKNWLDSLTRAPYPSNQHIEQMVESLDAVYTLLQKDSLVTSPLTKQIVVTDLAAALLNKARNQVSNEKDKLRILSQSNKWLLKSLKALDDQKDMQKAFLYADQNKSVLLLQATKSEAAYSLGALPDSLVQLDKKILKKQNQLQAKLIENRSKSELNTLRNELNQVNQDRVDFIKKIKKEHPKYYHFKYQQVDANVTDIQKLLDEETALLEYVIGHSVVHIFCVDKKQVLWKKSFIKNKKLALRIKKFHYVLSNYDALEKNKKLTYQAYTEQAYWFYQNLVAPVLKEKLHIKNLILVTDGELGHLPFEAFLKERAPQNLTEYNELHYLVTDYNISYNYSATLWKDNVEARTPENNGQILGLAANYNLQLDSSMRKIRLPADQLLRTELPTLPDARKEVETLQENYQGFFLFDTLASEKMVKENASDFAILHFATHGVLDSRKPILSSLAFTEDNDPIESNFWQAHEISEIKLNANLVVLSGCETGYGKFEKGNGIASLARAFMYAGASSLIVSLWQVNDYATAEIMKNLYKNLTNGMKKDEAVRQAKLQYMNSAKGIFAHPAFWSPFIQMGNTAPLSIKTKGGMISWFIGGGLLLLVFMGLFIRKHKKKI